jgi:flagellar basal body-associated protein FliL
MSEPTPAPVKKKGIGGLAFIVLALLALGGGAATPWLLPSSGGTHEETSHDKSHGSGHDAHGTSAKKKKGKAGESNEPKQAVIPFGDVGVRLAEERSNRYLRAKILIVVDDELSKDVTELLNKQKPFLKNWLLSYLSDQTVNDVSRAAGQNRLRREIRDQFNHKLFPDGSEKVLDVLMDEFLVQ